MKPVLKSLCLLLLSWPAIAPAWNATGHEVIAEIAWQQLTPETKREVRWLMKAFSEEYPHIRTLTQMAPWADQIRSQKIEYFTHWHYIDIPFSTDGTALKNITDTDNAVWALGKLKPVLSNHYANRHERARALAFMVHIVGDLHQPLHTVSQISAEWPEGDKGGNLFPLTPSETFTRQNLHHLWDTGAGLFSVPATKENVKALARQVRQDCPAARFGHTINQLEPQRWAEEGKQTAETEVYQTPAHKRPDESYMTRAKNIAECKSALAAYRLAALLNESLS